MSIKLLLLPLLKWKCRHIIFLSLIVPVVVALTTWPVTTWWHISTTDCTRCRFYNFQCSWHRKCCQYDDISVLMSKYVLSVPVYIFCFQWSTTGINIIVTTRLSYYLKSGTSFEGIASHVALLTLKHWSCYDVNLTWELSLCYTVIQWFSVIQGFS